MDLNTAAYEIVRRTTGEAMDDLGGKNPAAVALGRLGGVKGGKARAAKLSASRRSAIAKKAAKARWGKKAGITTMRRCCSDSRQRRWPMS